MIGPMVRPESVDAYLAAQAQPQRAALQRIRERVHALLPDVQDVISYSMPAFRLHGRILLWYAGWKEHCSLYPVTDEFQRHHAAELEGYRRSKGTLRFRPDQPLPPDLFEAFVEYRVRELERLAR